jgi:small subunit ribosomal protein S17
MGKLRKEYIGEVVSNKMQKTVVVAVERQFSHSEYHKVVRRRIRFKAHDERSECRVGDRVKVIQTRPLSKEKCWAVLEVVERAQV